jgi:hypothetical protein
MPATVLDHRFISVHLVQSFIRRSVPKKSKEKPNLIDSGHLRNFLSSFRKCREIETLIQNNVKKIPSASADG